MLKIKRPTDTQASSRQPAPWENGLLLSDIHSEFFWQQKVHRRYFGFDCFVSKDPEKVVRGWAEDLLLVCGNQEAIMKFI
jgi:hypothetical protein